MLNSSNALKIERKSKFPKKLSFKEKFMKLPASFKQDILSKGKRKEGDNFNENHSNFEAVLSGYLIAAECFSIDSKTNLLSSSFLGHFIKSGFEFSGEKYLTMIDINGLKSINDQFGHQTGDVYIEKICKNIISHMELLNEKEGIEKTDCIFTDISVLNTAFRYGGDEIVLITNKEIRDEVLDFISYMPVRVNENTVKGGVLPCFSYGKHSFSCKHSYVNAVSIADQIMYKKKGDYYKKNNLNRRTV